MVQSLDDGGRGWLFKTANKNYWKVKHVYDELADLTQDGFECWYKVANRYQDVDNYGRLMNLFKITFINRIKEVAAWKKDRNFESIVTNIGDLVDPEIPEARAIEWLEQSGRYLRGHDDSELERTIIEAAAPVRDAIRFLVSDDGIKKMRRPYRIRRNGARETTNERIRRNIGVSRGTDVRKAVRDYLKESIHQR
jgi:hypothetical protein